MNYGPAIKSTISYHPRKRTTSAKFAFLAGVLTGLLLGLMMARMI